MPSASLHAEDPHRQPADRAGDAIAIKIERRVVGRADIGDDIHLHAVDHGVEILPAQAELPDRTLESRQAAATLLPA